MLEISPGAAAFIVNQCELRNLGENGGMRVFQDPGAAEQRSVNLRYVPEPEAEDQVVERGDARVFLAPEVAPIVDPYVLDAVPTEDEEQRERLVLRKE